MIQFIENRKEPSSEQIQAKQNFNSILKEFEKKKCIDENKSYWGIYFFGAVGFASFLGIIISFI